MHTAGASETFAGPAAEDWEDEDEDLTNARALAEELIPDKPIADSDSALAEELQRRTAAIKSTLTANPRNTKLLSQQQQQPQPQPQLQLLQQPTLTGREPRRRTRRRPGAQPGQLEPRGAASYREAQGRPPDSLAPKLLQSEGTGEDFVKGASELEVLSTSVLASGAIEVEGLIDCSSRTKDELDLLTMMANQKWTWEQVLETAWEKRQLLGPAALADALYRAARRIPTNASQHNPSPAASPFYSNLLVRLRKDGLAGIQGGTALSHLAWTLGKFERHSSAGSPTARGDIDLIIRHICGLFPQALHECPPQEWTNALWGICWLYPGAARGRSGISNDVRRLSHAIVEKCAEQIEALTAQCIANSLYAMARLELHGKDVEVYFQKCLAQLGSVRDLDDFTTQGLANMIWALANLRGAGAESMRFALVRIASACSKRLEDFLPKELSMMATAFAKIYVPKKGDASRGTSRRSRSCARPTEVDKLLLGLAATATNLMPSFEDQGISNIAWALATLDLLGPHQSCAPARGFVEEAVQFSTPRLHDNFCEQAVSLLMWAGVRLDCSRPETRACQEKVDAFCAAAADDMAQRMEAGRRGAITWREQWRDLACVAMALSHGKQSSPSVLMFMEQLMDHAAEPLAKGELTPQQMLNIAQSAKRLGVHQTRMRRLVNSIHCRIETHGLSLNEVDLRQWGEVKNWCPPNMASHASEMTCEVPWSFDPAPGCWSQRPQTNWSMSQQGWSQQ